MWVHWIKESQKFIAQVLQEGERVIWPTRRDVFVTSIIVFVLAAMFAIFLFAIDQVVVSTLKSILRIS